MSLATIHSRAQDGVAAPAVTVEVHLSGGLPGTSIVGLPEAAVKEARPRARRDSERTPRLSGAARHGQSGTGRPARLLLLSLT